MKARSLVFSAVLLMIVMANPAISATRTPPAASTDSCFKTFQSVIDGAPAAGTYTDAVLDHLHAQLYRFNKIQTADVELMFCRLANVMSFNPDLSSLPQTISKTDPLGGTVSLTVTSPTETFATTNGYTAKAVLAYTAASATSATTFVTVWWQGSGSSSKGYLIQGDNPMETDGNTRLRYLQWDLTTSAQVIKFLGTQFATSYLSSTSGATNTKTGGDQAIYARITYNSSTQAVTAQAVEIRPISSSFKCIRTYFSGTLGGTITGYRPATGTPEPVTETSTGGAGSVGGGMDGEASIVDSKTTADHSGTPVSGSTLPTGTFDYSCNSINSAGNSSGSFIPFAGGTVSFTATPSSVFPN